MKVLLLKYLIILYNRNPITEMKLSEIYYHDIGYKIFGDTYTWDSFYKSLSFSPYISSNIMRPICVTLEDKDFHL